MFLVSVFFSCSVCLLLLLFQFRLLSFLLGFGIFLSIARVINLVELLSALLINEGVLLLDGGGLDNLVNLKVVVNTVIFPVVVISEEVEILLDTDVRGEVTAQGTREDGDDQGDAKGSKLNPSLLSSSSSVLHSFESFLEGCGVFFKGHFGESCRNRSNDSSNNSRKSVKVVNSTSIHEADLLFKPAAQVEEAKSRDDTGKASNSHGDSSSHDQVRGRSDGDTSSQSSVKNDFHLELSMSNSADGSRSQSTGGDGENGVDNNTLLLVLTGKSSVETGPEHEEEDSTNHSYSLRKVTSRVVVSSSSLVAQLLLEVVRSSAAEVSSEGVHVHRATHVDSL